MFGPGADRMGVLAIDHGASFARRLHRLLGRRPTGVEVWRERERIIRHLAPHSTGVVCDVDSLHLVFEQWLVPSGVAVIAGLPDLPVGWREKDPLPWSEGVVERVAVAGCDALKLCLLVSSTEPDPARLRLAEQMGRDCDTFGIAFILELVPSEDVLKRSGDAYASPVEEIDGVSLARSYGAAAPDLLKLHVPASAGGLSDEGLLEACRRVTHESAHPWAVLSAGTPYEVFRHQLEIACRGGASGFVAGTAIWQEALEIHDEQAREDFLRDVATSRLTALRVVAQTAGSAVSPPAVAPPPLSRGAKGRDRHQVER
jgi:tagatose 1,6-diphosphate aldolase